jgi:hypothetical protein
MLLVQISNRSNSRGFPFDFLFVLLANIGLIFFLQHFLVIEKFLDRLCDLVV